MTDPKVYPCPPGTIPEVKIIETPVYEDTRGTFAEVFKKSIFAKLDINFEIRQENQSLSVRPQTLRGLHFQTPPYSQNKLVRVSRGAIHDVAVDIRIGSPTYGVSVAATLSEQNRKQIYIPRGFAHGFLTLEPDTIVVYAVDSEYSREHDKGVCWNDPDIAVGWPLGEHEVVLSEKDAEQPRLALLPRYFIYEHSETKRAMG